MQWDAIRCNTMATRCNTKQYGGDGESIRLRYDNTIGNTKNSHEPMRTCAIQYDNAIVAHRIATYWVAANRRRIPMRMYNESMRMYNDEIRTNRNWHEMIRRKAMQYDAIRIGFDSQGQFESIRCWAMHKECKFVLVRSQNSRQWDGGINRLAR